MDAFITRRGSGIKEGYAMIAVTYPSGSTCTCSNGSKTLRAKDTSGEFLFIIPEAGTWTVSCMDGEKIASESVIISMQYQVETINLYYALIILDTNYLNPDVGSFEQISAEHTDTGTVSGSAKEGEIKVRASSWARYYYTSGTYRFTQPIDLTNFNTIHFEGSASRVDYYSGLWDGGGSIGLGTDRLMTDAKVLSSTATTDTIDISDKTGNWYLFFRASAMANDAATQTVITKLWID